MFKQKKNRKFNYKPRFQDSNSENHREQKSKDDFEEKWNEIKKTTNRRGNIFTSLPVLIVMLISLFVLIYILNGYIK
ncbi:hypothetical protein [Winogradskyella ursingii]|uniref:hypothetical protein n=1 Tax=Winogradskyella ursingii TaxID=2686079 RepID=UPI0015CE3860|nr:hypothetical protein [Winogradskyella ursingii]